MVKWTAVMQSQTKIFSFTSLLLVATSIGVTFLFNLVSPDEVDLSILLLVFLALVIIGTCLAQLAILLAIRLQSLIYKDLVLKRRFFVDTKKNIKYSVVVGAVPAVLIAMNTVQEVRLHEFILVLFLAAILLFYIFRKR